VQQNIATRVGVLAINDVDRRNQRKLNDSNWRLLVDRPRARSLPPASADQDFAEVHDGLVIPLGQKNQ
jgi:hypothetical protein